MTAYPLLQANASQSAPGTVQGGAAGSNLPTGSQAASIPGGVGRGGQSQGDGGLQVIALANSTVAATVQAVASNDGVNWANAGGTVTLSGTSVASVFSVVTVPAVWYSAYCTSLSGTSPTIKAILSI